MLNYKLFESQFALLEMNFNFKYSPDLLGVIFEKIKTLGAGDFKRAVGDILTLDANDWNKKCGFGNKTPPIATLIELLTGKKPLSSVQIAEEKRKYEEKIRHFAALIAVWLNDKNLEISFINRYKAFENLHLRAMIDRFLNIREHLSDERIVKMGLHLRGIYQKDKKAFFEKMIGIAKEQNQLLLN